MRPRIIEDEILIQMLHEGKQQKEIAEYFRVSPVAVCNRIKRLFPEHDTEIVLDSHNLTDKEKSFVIEKARGKSNIQAMLASQYEVTSTQSAKVMGSQLMGKPEIQVAIDELMDAHGLTKSYRIGKLKSHVDNRDPNVSIKALDLSWKLDGSYAPEKIVSLSLDTLLVQHNEIDAEIDKLKKKLAALLSGNVGNDD